MIVRQNTIAVEKLVLSEVLEINGVKDVYKNALFFDLEHYVYKKPICVGVFGCCYYQEESNAIKVTQYMIENKKDAVDILHMAEEYFKKAFAENNKKYIVTFSGNNDYTVINYLLKKYKIKLNLDDHFEKIDIQELYEASTKNCIGLKALEKIFEINRENELISGSNLAKTFNKIMKDESYIQRMPKEKVQKILLYNEQDVISLFHMLTRWNKYIVECDVQEEQLQNFLGN
jgi:uncharacterized protein YprB with RNaseH-like and TPR domain